MAEVEFNDSFFHELGTSAGVTQLCRVQAERVLAAAKASAPVGEGDYRNGLQIRQKQSATRNVVLVVGTDWKTMIIESKTGNLARALNQVKKSG